MIRIDPHGGYTPGQGCGCLLCIRSTAEPVLNRLEGLLRANAYREQRRVWREEHGLPLKNGRGVGSSTVVVAATLTHPADPLPFPKGRSAA